MAITLKDLTNRIIQHLPSLYCKFGDGEYLCMIGTNGANCDRTSYTAKLQDGLIRNYKYLIHQPNVFISHWSLQTELNYFKQLSQIDFINQPYCLILFLKSRFENNDFRDFISSIKDSQLNKILVANKYMVKMNPLLNIQKHIEISQNDWFESNFDQVLENVKTSITSEKFILMTCGGMGSKVLIGELHKLYPLAIYLDIGSGFDFICTKIDSRGWGFTNEIYSQLTTYLDGVLPNDWNDPKYDWIYEKAYNDSFHPLNNYIK